jgi:hypothetical protein
MPFAIVEIRRFEPVYRPIFQFIWVYLKWDLIVNFNHRKAPNFQLHELSGILFLQEHKMCNLNMEGVAKLRFCRFSGFFEPIFRFFSGGNINIAYITP